MSKSAIGYALAAGAALALAVGFAQPAGAQEEGVGMFSSGKLKTTSGAEVFEHICQGCHMPDGKGAAGAGTYPSLAGNPNLGAGGYPVEVVVNGQRGMPAFGPTMSDDQVVAVVNFLRTHFGNNYRDVVTAEDVKSVRRQK